MKAFISHFRKKQKLPFHFRKKTGALTSQNRSGNLHPFHTRKADRQKTEASVSLSQKTGASISPKTEAFISQNRSGNLHPFLCP
jgi:hypothetical protein